MSTPDWLEDLDPFITNPFARLINRIQVRDVTYLKQIPSEITDKEKEILEGLHPPYTINKLIVQAIKHGNSLEPLIKYLSWSDFEAAIATILKHGGWTSQINFRFFGEGVPGVRSRYEIDILGVKKPFVLVIDCKRYSTTSQAPMREAAEKQKERVYVFFEQLPILHDSFDSNFPRWKTPVKILPIILTWKDHQLHTHKNVPICCISQFEDFLVNLDTYLIEHDLFHLIWDTYV